MKNIVRSFIISLALFGCCFASKNNNQKAFQMLLVNDAQGSMLGRALSFLNPKEDLSQIQQTSKHFKTTSDNVLPNVSLKTMYALQQDETGRNVLKLYDHAKDLERDVPFEQTNETNEIVANTYTLAIITKNKKVKNRLRDVYKNLLKQISEEITEEEEKEELNKILQSLGKDNLFKINNFYEFKKTFERVQETLHKQRSKKLENAFFKKVFKWAGKNNFFKDQEQKKEIITVLHTFFNNDLLNLYFQQISLDEIKADNRGDVLYNAVLANLENIVEKILNTPNYTNEINVDTRARILEKAIELVSENIVEKILNTPDFTNGIARNAARIIIIEKAVESGSENIVEKILNIPNITNRINTNAKIRIIKKSIKTGSENIVERILNNFVNILEFHSYEIHYIFEKAIESGSENIVEKILNISYFIHEMSEHYRGELLNKVIRSDSENIVEKMLNKPHFIYRIYSYHKREALETAVEKNNTRIVKLLLNSLEFTTEQLKQAIQKTSNEKIKKLLVAKLPWLPWLKRKIKCKIKNLLKQK